MKHLKLFENFIENDDLYKKISVDYLSEMIESGRIKSEKTTRNDIVKLRRLGIYVESGNIGIALTNYVNYKNGHDKKYQSSAFKLTDEYWLYTYLDSEDINFYLCDQIDGLLECLKDNKCEKDSAYQAFLYGQKRNIENKVGKFMGLFESFIGDIEIDDRKLYKNVSKDVIIRLLFTNELLIEKPTDSEIKKLEPYGLNKDFVIGGKIENLTYSRGSWVFKLNDDYWLAFNNRYCYLCDTIEGVINCPITR